MPEAQTPEQVLAAAPAEVPDYTATDLSKPFDIEAQRRKVAASLGLPDVKLEPRANATPGEPPAAPQQQQPVEEQAPPPAESELEEEEEEQQPDDEEEEESDDEEEELNLDEDDESDEEEEEEEDALSAEEIEAMRADDTHAVKRAKEEGRMRKQLQREVQALEERNTQLQTKHDEMQKELEKFQTTRIDPSSHPDFIEIKKRVHSSIIGSIDDEVGSSAAAIFEQGGWGNELTKVASLSGATVAERREIKEPLRLDIAKKVGLVPNDTAELDPSIDDEAIRTADRIISILSRHTQDYNNLADTYTRIQSKAEGMSLAMGHQEYVERTQPIRQTITAISTLEQKHIDEDPDSLISLAAKKIGDNPKAKAKFDLITKAVIEMQFGPEALSQEELDRFAQSGRDMEEFHKTREKRVAKFREDQSGQIAALLLLLPEIKQALPQYFSSKAKAASKDKVRKVISGTKPGTVAKKAEPAPVTTKESLLSAIDRSLGTVQR